MRLSGQISLPFDPGAYFLTGDIPVTAEKATYSVGFVFLSYVVAVMASYVALSLSQRLVNAPNGKDRDFLHWGGAVALGIGIWSMHFIGMIAYKSAMDITYDPVLTGMSMLVAIGFSYGVLAIVSRPRLTLVGTVLGAILLGIGISGMHYIGMAAMRMQADMRYIPSIFLASILVAMIASGAALWMAFALARHKGEYLPHFQYGAALIMGLAICGMHYTGMAACVMTPFPDAMAMPPHHASRSLMLAVTALPLFLLVLFTITISRRLFLTLMCGVLFSLPLMIIVYEATMELEVGIVFARKERIGLTQHKSLFDLMVSTQRVRGLTNVFYRGNPAVRDDLEAERKTLRHDLATVDTLFNHASETVPDTQVESWRDIRSDVLAQLDTPDKDPATAFRHFTDTIAAELTLMETAANRTNLSVDPDVNSHYLADASVFIVPRLVETLG